MSTTPFGPRNEPPDPMLARAAELPKDVAPRRDLWPGIAARIAERPEQARPRAFGWPAALAAAVLVASVSALLTWGIVRDESPAPTTQAQLPPAGLVPVNYGTRSGLTTAELAARDDLYAKFRDKFGELRPETREIVLKNLAVIQTAADEIDAALAQDPASGMLNEMLIGAYKQELQLYSMVVKSGDRVTRRT
jgi:hypothetical protein